MSETVETLESFNQISLELSQAMNKSEYDKVIFHEVADFYFTDADVECRFTLTSTVVPSEGDRVGLFKVGWEYSHQSVNYEWIVLPEDCDYTAEMFILFKAHDLPKDDGEYYQFCYITHDGCVRGASTPFKFRRPSDDDLIEVEDDDNDLMIIRSRTAVFEDRLRKVAASNHELLKEKTILEEKLAEKEKLCAETEGQLKAREEELAKVREEIVAQSEQREEEQKRLRAELEDAYNNSDKQKSDIQSLLLQNDAYISELRETVKVLTAEKVDLSKKVASESEEAASLKKQLSETDTRLKAFDQQTKQLSKELTVQREAARRLQNQIKVLEGNMTDKQKNVADLKTQLAQAEEECNRLNGLLLDTGHMLTAMEKSKHLATEELMLNVEAKKKIVAELESIRSNYEILQEKFLILEGDHKKEMEKNSILETELNNLTERCQDLEKGEEENAAFKQQSASSESVLKVLVDDLTVRLKTGAAEYQTKYIECLKLQKKLGKLKQKYKIKLHSDSKEETKAKSEGDVFNSCDVSTSSEEGKLPPKSHLQKQQQLELYEIVIAEKDRVISNLDNEIKKLQAQANGANKQKSEIPSRKCVSSTATATACTQLEGTRVRYPYPEPEMSPAKDQARISSMINSYPHPPVRQLPIHPPANPFAIYESDVYSSSSYPETGGQKKPVVIATRGNNISDVENSAKGVQIETLPTPIQPKATNDAKLAAVMAVTRRMEKLPSDLEPKITELDSSQFDGFDVNVDAGSHSEELDPFSCPMCQKQFKKAPFDYAEVQAHLDSHFNLECPICSTNFDSSDQKKFEQHVDRHFEDENKPSVGKHNPFTDLGFD